MGSRDERKHAQMPKLFTTGQLSALLHVYHFACLIYDKHSRTNKLEFALGSLVINIKFAIALNDVFGRTPGPILQRQMGRRTTHGGVSINY